MQHFIGFTDTKALSIQIPDQFVTELLPLIDNLTELKITLYALWFIQKSGDEMNPIILKDFLSDSQFIAGLGNNLAERKKKLIEGLEKTLKRGSLITGASKPYFEASRFFLNSPRGRKALVMASNNTVSTDKNKIKTEKFEKQNIFHLYEENFGPLTPMIADALRDTEKTYSMQWINEAMHIAIKNNVRRWRYVEAILKSWHEEGHHGTDKENPGEDIIRYAKERFGKS